MNNSYRIMINKGLFLLVLLMIINTASSQSIECCDTVYTYYEDSTIKTMGLMDSKGREQETLQKWHANGQLEIRISFLDGKKNGYSESWNSKGVLVRKVMYTNDLENGDFKLFDNKGNLRTHWIFENGEFKKVVFGEPPY